MPDYSYTYEDKNGQPLKKCPKCGGDLAAHEDGIQIELYDDGRGNWHEDSHLLADGTLHDPYGHVAAGLHSSTQCGHCGEDLFAMKGVAEIVHE